MPVPAEIIAFHILSLLQRQFAPTVLIYWKSRMPYVEFGFSPPWTFQFRSFTPVSFCCRIDASSGFTLQKASRGATTAPLFRIPVR